MFRFLRRQSVRWPVLLGWCELAPAAISLCLATRIRYARHADELAESWVRLPQGAHVVADLATQIRHDSLRHSLTAGLAGGAQPSHPYGAAVEKAAGEFKYDLFNVKNHHLLLDLLIRTVEVVLLGRGLR